MAGLPLPSSSRKPGRPLVGGAHMALFAMCAITAGDLVSKG